MADFCADNAQQVDFDVMNKWFAGCGNVKLFELHKNNGKDNIFNIMV